MITSSHNPASWNGLKPVFREGRLPFAEELESMLSATGPPGVGRGQRHVDTNDYPAALAGKFTQFRVSGRKVVVDSGGGVIGHFLPRLVEEMGYQATWLFDAPGVFTRNSDPTIDTLAPLRALVRGLGADLGLAFDPDGDRLVVVDSAGNLLGPDMAVLLALRRLLEITSPHAAVVSVDTSQAIPQFLRARGLSVHMAAVGEPNVVREMLRHGAQVGVEGSSGGLIWDELVRGRDGALAGCLILQLLVQASDLDGVLAQSPRMYSVRMRVQCPRSKAPALLDRLAQEHSGAERVDGVKLWISSSSWVLVRASNTEDVVRVSTEAASPEEAQALADEWAHLVRQRLEQL
jgi:phosphomannomutase